jgi:MoxR-like ATPase
VNLAIALGQPLLLTGDPGTGKTQLAASVAWELGWPGPHVFRTKTTSTARDLFYRYDALRHFRDVQPGMPQPAGAERKSIYTYIDFAALGRAILLAQPEPDLPDEVQVMIARFRTAAAPVRSVVLIDEIDKAPRDLPNDVLDEVEEMAFTIVETGSRFTAEVKHRPLVILTSNSEKNLPDAFLRRCIFCHLEFPMGEELRRIVQRRLGGMLATPDSRDRIKRAIRHFELIRDLPGLGRAPATAELLAWLRVLIERDIDIDMRSEQSDTALARSYSVLAKTKLDLKTMEDSIGTLPRT